MPDYCTLWPEGVWAHCCKAHDLAYSLGSTSKLQADAELAKCVADTGYPIMGIIMGVGTALGGWFFYKRKGTKKCTD